MSDQFLWQVDDSVVVRTQMAVAVYLNPKGDLVIRQEGQYHPEEDVCIVVAPHNVPAVLRAIEAIVPQSIEWEAAPKDTTAAARQRRRRDKHRDTRDSVTPSATVTGRDIPPPGHRGLPLAAE